MDTNRNALCDKLLAIGEGSLTQRRRAAKTQANIIFAGKRENLRGESRGNRGAGIFPADDVDFPRWEAEILSRKSRQTTQGSRELERPNSHNAQKGELILLPGIR